MVFTMHIASHYLEKTILPIQYGVTVIALDYKYLNIYIYISKGTICVPLLSTLPLQYVEITLFYLYTVYVKC